MRKKNKDLIDLFEENETNISELYRIYSLKLRGHKLFWQRLSDEEIRHAKGIRGICRDIEGGFIENKFARGAVNYVIDFVEKQIKQAKKGNLSHLDALNTALRIEQSILEKKCFDFFSPTDTTMENLMHKLNKETDQHVKILLKELKRTVNSK